MGITSTLSRKADLRRHFSQLHHSNAQWLCPEDDCRKAFDCKSAFDLHMKTYHSSNRGLGKESMVKLCPQLVFACGFSRCRCVFEAKDEQGAEDTAETFFKHVAKHFEDNDKNLHLNWSYSVRFRNLMRQKSVGVYWKQREKSASEELVWQPHSSSVLRRMLETRHLPDVPLLVQLAVKLGSSPYSDSSSPVPEGLPAGLFLPVKQQCPFGSTGHASTTARNLNQHPRWSVDSNTSQGDVSPPRIVLEGQTTSEDLPNNLEQRYHRSLGSPPAPQYSSVNFAHESSLASSPRGSFIAPLDLESSAFVHNSPYISHWPGSTNSAVSDFPSHSLLASTTGYSRSLFVPVHNDLFSAQYRVTPPAMQDSGGSASAYVAVDTGYSHQQALQADDADVDMDYPPPS